MARTLNFDAVVVETIDITKGGVTAKLRDDVPMQTLVRTFALMEKQQELSGRDDVDAEMATRWLDELQAMTLSLCGDIFRHSLPEMTDSEIAARFSFEEQLQLVMLFFTNRSSQLQRQQGALAPSSPTTSQPVTASQNTPANSLQASSATGNRRPVSRRRGAPGATSQPKR